MLIPDDQLRAILIKSGLVNEKGLDELAVFARNSSVNLADAIVEKDIISDEKMGALIAEYLKVPFVTLSKLQLPEDILHIVPEKIARKQKVVAFAHDQTGVKLAMNDPANKIIQEMIEKKNWLKSDALLCDRT